ncbi:MAG: DUF983 domain-containing protein [Alphaproteobacteria bacterium]
MTDMVSDNQTTLDVDNRSLGQAMMRGARGKCPSCGEGKVFSSYLKINDNCPHCDEALYHHRADDAPPYLTIFVLGHILIPLLLIVEKAYSPAMWVHWAIWPLLSIILTLTLLPIIKGAFVNLQWALRLHGFGEAGDSLDPPSYND